MRARYPAQGPTERLGVRTPLHLNPATGKREGYWIGRDYPTKTAAEKARSKWMTEFDAGKVRVSSDMKLGAYLHRWVKNLRKEGQPWPGTRRRSGFISSHR